MYRPPETQAHAASSIAAIGIITADRPRRLQRCLAAIVPHLHGYQAPMQIIVVDGSTKARNQSHTRNIVRTLAADANQSIAFVGRREARLIRDHVRASCSDEIAQFALHSTPAGSRNIVTMLTAGANVMLVDDDVVCEPWRVPSLQPCLEICGHAEERTIAFFHARRDVCEGLVPSSENLLTAHEVILGRSVHALAGDASLTATFPNACRHMRDAAVGIRPAVVRATFSGLAGDSGWNYPERLLFSTGTWQSILASSRTTYERALTFREMRRVAQRYLVLHHTGCMAGCMGLANTSILPPFLNVGRNEDGLFGAMLSAIDRTAVYGHVPHAVLHDSPRAARYTGPALRSARETRLADVMIELTAAWSRSDATTDPVGRLTALATWFGELARMKRDEFVDVITAAILAVRQREIEHIEAALSAGSHYPVHWQRDLRRYAEVLGGSLRRRGFFLPTEFHRTESIERGYDAARRFVRLSGALLSAWPTLWSTTRAIRPAITPAGRISRT